MENTAYLHRILKTEFYTIGKLQLYNSQAKLLFECMTLELPYRDNKQQVSSIPSGSYQMKISNSPKFGTVYKILNVLNRSNILIHKGNYASDTQGCILLGQELLLPANFEKGMILNSKQAYINLMKLGLNELTIKISELC